MKNPTVEILIAIQIQSMVNKTEHDLIELNHARGNLIISARDAVELEESPNSCEDDTSSESSDSDDSLNNSS